MVHHQYDDVWIVIPVYNEAPVVRAVIEHVLTVFPNVVCVDDGSSDGSIEEIAVTRAHLVRHPVNLGQGASLETGLAYARSQPGAAYFVTFDADGQHRTSDAEAMIAVARSGEADVVLGTRFGSGAGEQQVPRLKRVVLRAAALTSPSSRRLKLTDAHNGLRVLTRPVADDLRITMNGMAHASEIVQHLSHSAWRVREVPVTIDYTDYSRSKGQSLINGVNILFDLSLRQRKG
ncbi:glycosyltransferase [Nocardioides sp. MAH-18]|uniref:Glycosyltransferase n=1 Tax=Nocardioides agri TaxID=2682843 RepID=A0A6L6XMP1_9ACTN|nr:glycosyltransferase family 2 protein [Nocardioides sp. CGMCC 1.13656]MBA2953473.1 glycosyltransferase family 2 protein [Nocardioides sp. CGMCC 1.13656]MVQ48340.1 glycosyltransferase [Nocardioides sp. MAH-18]